MVDASLHVTELRSRPCAHHNEGVIGGRRGSCVGAIADRVHA